MYFPEETVIENGTHGDTRSRTTKTLEKPIINIANLNPESTYQLRVQRVRVFDPISRSGLVDTLEAMIDEANKVADGKWSPQLNHGKQIIEMFVRLMDLTQLA